MHRSSAQPQDLNRLDSSRSTPTILKHEPTAAPSPEQLAEFLESKFRCDSQAIHHDPPAGFGIPDFSMEQLWSAVNGIFAEMFTYAWDKLLSCLLNIFNTMLRTGNLEHSWRTTYFTMFFNNGNRKQPSNWRPITILQQHYNIFPNLLYLRLRDHLHYLHSQRPHAQTGFRPNFGVHYAFATVENVYQQVLGKEF